MSIESTIMEMAKEARAASMEIARCPSNKKNDVLLKIADKIETQATYIQEENQKDLAMAKETGLSDAMMDRLMLDEPWPNPARDRTLLRYAARSDAPVTLRIFDVQGRLVSDLEDFARGDGVIRTTPWFTDDVPSGVYFVGAGPAAWARIVVLR